MRLVFFVFSAFFAFLAGCASSAGFVVASDDTGEAADTAALETDTDAAPLEVSSDGTPLEVSSDTLERPDVKPEALELEADAPPPCSSSAPGCCPTTLPGDLAACEAAGGGSPPPPKGWTWTRTANTAFRCSSAVVPPSPQPCDHAYRLGGGVLFCCVVGS